MKLRACSLWLLGVVLAKLVLYCCGQTWTPVLSPDCTALTPQSCDIIPALDGDGNYVYDTYWEDCNNHQCTLISPIGSWFCNASIVSYQARVEANTGLSPGVKEDNFANCHYNRLKDLLTFMNCRDRTFWQCSDCSEAYKYWICAVAFPQCTPSPPLHVSTLGPFDVEHAIYGTELNPHGYVNYTIIKPCRGICFDVYRKCPYAINFQCPPLYDMRDYHDWPSCNNVGNLNIIQG